MRHATLACAPGVDRAAFTALPSSQGAPLKSAATPEVTAALELRGLHARLDVQAQQISTLQRELARHEAAQQCAGGHLAAQMSEVFLALDALASWQAESLVFGRARMAALQERGLCTGDERLAWAIVRTGEGIWAVFTVSRDWHN